MKLIKLTVLPLLLSTVIVAMVACEPDAEMKKITDFEKKMIVMSGAQQAPANSSSAIGSMDVFYTKETRTLTYKLTWSGLADSVSAIRIHGLAPAGYATASVAQFIVGPSAPVTPIFPQKTSGKFTYAKSGTLTGTLLVDGVVIKEADLLNGMYYVNISSNAPAYSAAGEIRGQIKFQ